MPREHTEFYEIDMENGWEDILGYPKGCIMFETHYYEGD